MLGLLQISILHISPCQRIEPSMKQSAGQDSVQLRRRVHEGSDIISISRTQLISLSRRRNAEACVSHIAPPEANVVLWIIILQVGQQRDPIPQPPVSFGHTAKKRHASGAGSLVWSSVS